MLLHIFNTIQQAESTQAPICENDEPSLRIHWRIISRCWWFRADPLVDDNGIVNELWPVDDDCIKTAEHELPTAVDGVKVEIRPRDVDVWAEDGALAELPDPKISIKLVHKSPDIL